MSETFTLAISVTQLSGSKQLFPAALDPLIAYEKLVYAPYLCN